MKNIKTTTRRLFVTTQIAALGWVTMSYIIALYATVRLGQVFPVVDLSKQAIETILGVNVLKVVENIFEHNDGVVFGKSNAPEKKPLRLRLLRSTHLVCHLHHHLDRIRSSLHRLNLTRHLEFGRSSFVMDGVRYTRTTFASLADGVTPP